jgi:hypothetical protein
MYAADLGDLSLSVELHDLPRIAAFPFSPDTILDRALLVLVERRLYIPIATRPETAPSNVHLARLFEGFEVWAP